MKVVYNHDIDILYIELLDEDVFTTREIGENCVADIGADGRLIGLEISDACKHGIDALNVRIEQVVTTETDLRPPSDEEARAKRKALREAHLKAKA